MVILRRRTGCRDVDYLRHHDVDTAVEDELDTLDPALWPDELVVMGYVEDESEPDEGDEPEAGVVRMVHDEECDVVVNVAAWVREHAPHWAEDPDVAARLAAADEP